MYFGADTKVSLFVFIYVLKLNRKSNRSLFFCCDSIVASFVGIVAAYQSKCEFRSWVLVWVPNYNLTAVIFLINYGEFLGYYWDVVRGGGVVNKYGSLKKFCRVELWQDFNSCLLNVNVNITKVFALWCFKKALLGSRGL